MTSSAPVDVLEQKAAEQRRHLHNSVVELRQSVRQTLDVKRNVRRHLGPVAAGLAIVGLVFGYSLAGVFTSD